MFADPWAPPPPVAVSPECQRNLQRALEILEGETNQEEFDDDVAEVMRQVDVDSPVQNVERVVTALCLSRRNRKVMRVEDGSVRADKAVNRNTTITEEVLEVATPAAAQVYAKRSNPLLEMRKELNQLIEEDEEMEKSAAVVGNSPAAGGDQLEKGGGSEPGHYYYTPTDTRANNEGIHYRSGMLKEAKKVVVYIRSGETHPEGEGGGGSSRGGVSGSARDRDRDRNAYHDGGGSECSDDSSCLRHRGRDSLDHDAYEEEAGARERRQLWHAENDARWLDEAGQRKVKVRFEQDEANHLALAAMEAELKRRQDQKEQEDFQRMLAEQTSQIQSDLHAQQADWVQLCTELSHEEAEERLALRSDEVEERRKAEDTVLYWREAHDKRVGRQFTKLAQMLMELTEEASREEEDQSWLFANDREDD